MTFKIQTLLVTPQQFDVCMVEIWLQPFVFNRLRLTVDKYGTRRSSERYVCIGPTSGRHGVTWEISSPSVQSYLFPCFSKLIVKQWQTEQYLATNKQWYWEDTESLQISLQEVICSMYRDWDVKSCLSNQVPNQFLFYQNFHLWVTLDTGPAAGLDWT